MLHTAAADGRGDDGGIDVSDAKDDLGLPSFRSLLDEDWYLAPAAGGIKALSFPSDPPPPPSPYALPPAYPPTNAIASFLDALCSNPFDAGLDLGDETSNSPVLLGTVAGCGGSGGQMGASSSNLLLIPGDGSDLSSGCFDPRGSLHYSEILQPLETFLPVGALPSMFQKRAAMRGDEGASLALTGSEREKRRRECEEDDTEEPSFDGSAWNYESEEAGLENSNGQGDLKNADTTATGGRDQKGKGKGLPAKNLMAERRRRKKLNDRLYMLRSIVPKISKMDRTSILGDAIEYLKELLQRINDLHNELESTPSSSSLPNTTATTTNFHPTPTLPCRAKEESGPSSLSSPTSQTPRVEVRVREGRAVNIHMFCARKPGLLLSTIRALDSLGLDIQQAVISCFNGFALDVFRAEQCDEEEAEVLPEEIRTVLLRSAGYNQSLKSL